MTSIEQAFEHYRRGDLHNAEKTCRAVLAADDRSADGWLLLGVLADHARAADDAKRFLHRAAELAPRDPRIWNTLGTVLDGQHDLDGAAGSYQKALQARPDYAPACHNLGEVQRALGRHKEAAELYRKALLIDPTLAPAASNRLFNFHFDPELNDELIWDEHRRWGEDLAARVQAMPSPANDANPDRVLTIGYIGPDFREHAVARFFEPLLAAHDRRRFRIVLYSECPIVDDVGKRLRVHNDTWRIVRGQPADLVAQQVRADGVDILVELAGHTRDNRLDVMARKPAPVQCTFLGYPYPTGLPRIDYRITDSVLDPLDLPVRTGIGESLLRLPPGVCCFLPPKDAPPVNALPLAKNGFITFGSHHPLPKLNHQILRLWGRIAKALPSARFLFVRNSWEGAPARELKARLAECGLPENRVELRRTSIKPGDYLLSFHDMDVILDATPFNGHTMTCEALNMGVPVLTLRGDRPAGRLSSSVLTAMKLDEFISESADDFVKKAVDLANARSRLKQVRATLREILQSTIGNASYYARCLENLYREAWRGWCRTQGRTPVAPQPVIPTDWSDVHTRGCNVLEAGNADEAAALFREASKLNPNAVPPRAMLAGILSDRCDLAGAQEQYDLAMKAAPDAKLRIAAATMLPPIYQNNDQLLECRALLQQRLQKLHEENVTLDPMRGPIPNLFHVAYQGFNDRDIMASFAKLFAPPAWATEPIACKPRADGRKKIGFISQYLCNHTIGTLNLGFIQHLDRKKYHISVLTCSNEDETAAIYKQHADDYIRLPGEMAAAARLIRGLNLDLAYFPDLGMSCVTLALAHAKLGRKQAVGWGHPLTTGIATIDDFLSSQLYETVNSQEHYNEKLIALNGLNTYYHRPSLDRTYTREEFKLPGHARLYGCPQTLFKFHHDFDAILRGILEADANGYLVLIKGRNKSWKEQLLKRWAGTMPGVLDRLIWLPTLPRASFLGLTSLCDVMLDPPHFGGGNTTLEALALGTPVVTMPTPYLRARLTQGFYKHINCQDYIARDAEDYIRIAVRKPVHSREDLARLAAPLFEDRESLKGFEEYLEGC